MTEVFPLEFVVHGTPPSVNKSGKKDRYQARVRREARKSLPRRRYVPTVEPVIVRMVFCFDKSAGLDTDNFIKWIFDAMIRTVYHEDSQVIDVVASARRFAAAGQIRGAPPLIGQTLASIERDFVYISVNRADERELP